MIQFYDQLHQFADRDEAEAAFGSGRDEEGRQAASWLHGDVTVAPISIALHDPALDALDPETGEPVRGRRPADGYWLGLATTEPLALAASTRFAFTRPAGPTPWREAVTWSALPLDQITVIECGAFAGSGYVFD